MAFLTSNLQAMSGTRKQHDWMKFDPNASPSTPTTKPLSPKAEKLRKLKLPLLDLPSPETDTLIYLSPISSPSPPLRCSSQKLLATGSPVFQRLLGPTCQFRLLRRKNLLKLGLPMGVKFVIDLSPPEEGDEAVEVVEKLWCPDEVLSWKSKLEGGYTEPDEDEEPERLQNTHWPQSLEVWLGDSEDNWTLGWKAEAELDPYGLSRVTETPKQKSASVSYSPTRHTAAIERVLHIIHGLDPQIHTTPMWYTVHKVALHLECTSTVQDHIISWLYGNLDFIERYPGLVLRIADEVKNVALFRDAFAILVGTQLLGGRIRKAGAFAPIPTPDHVPAEALPWKKHILFARKSLQDRLERLYKYVSSIDWLDNALVITEYSKLTSVLNSPYTPQDLKALSSELNIAIREDISTALRSLFVFSEDPGHPDWVNPWEKGIFDLIPRERQIYSRVYWKQLSCFTRPPPAGLFSNNVMSRLWAWEGAIRSMKDIQELEKATCLSLSSPPRYYPNIEPSARHSILEVRSAEARGKGKTTDQTSLRTATNKWCTDTPSQRWKRISTQLKEVLRAASPGPCTDGQSLTLPPITDFGLGETRLPSLDTTNLPMSLSPSSYDDTENTLPRYSEHQLPEIEVPESACRLSLLRMKRKSMSEDPFVDQQHSSDEETDEECDSKVEVTVSTCVLLKAERIEIINPIAKRRCSVERGEGDDDSTAASFSTQVGEPEMFKISGVYDESEIEETLENSHWLEERRDATRNGKGKEVDRSNQNTEAELTFQDTVDCVFDEGASAKAESLNPEAAYWHPDNVRARTKGKEKSPIRSTEVELETFISRFSEHNQEDPSRHDPDPNQPHAPISHDPMPEIPTLDVRSFWEQLARAQLLEESEAGEGPSQLEEAEPPLRGSVWTSPVAQHNFNTLCPYTSIPDLLFSADPSVLCTYRLWTQCLSYLHAVGGEALKVPISFEPMQAGDGQVLVCLRDEEWRFMPLWAGGLEDGSGGVFGEFVEPPPPREAVEENDEGDAGDATEVESLGSYDDCMDVESMGSFVSGGFSEFEDTGSVGGSSPGKTVMSESEFGDSDAGMGAESDVETREDSEVESLGESTEDESEDEETDSFEEIGWESA